MRPGGGGRGGGRAEQEGEKGRGNDDGDRGWRRPRLMWSRRQRFELYDSTNKGHGADIFAPPLPRQEASCIREGPGVLRVSGWHGDCAIKRRGTLLCRFNAL